eukprot:CAMPEP_0196158554 /NCGR_PEP_ID=MMETSP0910-20130528/45870_1 /TAXON_ID=49265 /ORGANISM="Thalassiosira rotula, Strain GSO102" /LENGTH=363 /DNA_ID=CAMNT_0041423457 /DNA_START=143 /DNA_END=1234 /DNA_ORIENTATION=-
MKVLALLAIVVLSGKTSGSRVGSVAALLRRSEAAGAAPDIDAALVSALMADMAALKDEFSTRVSKHAIFDNCFGVNEAEDGSVKSAHIKEGCHLVVHGDQTVHGSDTVNGDHLTNGVQTVNGNHLTNGAHTVTGDHLSVRGGNLFVSNGHDSFECAHVVGDTGLPSCSGNGNIIVGHDLQGAKSGGHEITGDHNIVLGRGHTVSSHGGIVSGVEHTVNGPHGSAIAGSSNTVTGEGAVAVGGKRNDARGDGSGVSGYANEATGTSATAFGGGKGKATGEVSVVVGGLENAASGYGSSVTGGTFNGADGINSSVTGGDHNRAIGDLSSVSGGLGNEIYSGASYASILGGPITEPLGTCHPCLED